MKILTLLGTRPELIRLSRLIPRLDSLLQAPDHHIVVDTQQSYDDNMSGVFYRELGIRPPDYCLGARGTFAEQMATICTGLEKVIREEKPDRFLVLGDTNSSLGAIVAARMGVPVYHMEAGNRCHDPASPEEVNRKIIDHCTTVHLPYSEGSRRNLLAEGIAPHRITVTGNPMREVLIAYDKQISAARPCKALGLDRCSFLLSSFHRQENVDNPERLGKILTALGRAGDEHGVPVLVSVHPRTALRLKDMDLPAGLIFTPAMGFFDFVALFRAARAILSDSGTAQEEAAILGVPCVTLRDSTERPETLEAGTNIVTGVEPEMVLRGLRWSLSRGDRNPPEEYRRWDVSEVVAGVLLGNLL